MTSLRPLEVFITVVAFPRARAGSATAVVLTCSGSSTETPDTTPLTGGVRLKSMAMLHKTRE